MEESELTQNKLKELLHYNELTGIFTWKERPASMFVPGEYQDSRCKTWNTRFANKEAGHTYTPKESKTSYINVRVTLNGEQKGYKAHRLVFLYTDGHFPPEAVDHIDGNGMNNRRDNLREVSRQENNKNMPMYSNNASGTVGVNWREDCQKWQVRINVDGKNIYGGCFKNKKDAIEKRKQIEIEYDFHQNHGRKNQ